MTDSEVTGIPIVDLSPLALTPAEQPWNPEDADPEVIAHLAAQIYNAFTECGFVYLKGHGVPQAQVDNMNKCTGDFFALPKTVKSQYPLKENFHGWIDTEEEGLSTKVPDYKEFFNIAPSRAKDRWPDDHVTGFKDTTLALFTSSERLGHVVLYLMAVGMGLKDPTYFVKQHNALTRANFTTLRSLFYPSLPDDLQLAPGTMRCGEHTDWGSITILYQDVEGGLEVFSRKQNQFIPATPIEGTVVVNIADCMQRWTSDVYVSTKHRVLLPEDEGKKRRVRRTNVFFLTADDDCVVTCADGSNKYDPITVEDYIKLKFSQVLTASV